MRKNPAPPPPADRPPWASPLETAEAAIVALQRVAKGTATHDELAAAVEKLTGVRPSWRTVARWWAWAREHGVHLPDRAAGRPSED